MDRKQTLMVLITVSVLLTAGYAFGRYANQRDIEDRALTMNKECYDAIDLEYFIRGVKPH